MATFNLAIVVPDAQLARVQTAIKAYYATNGNPSPTNAQAIEALRQEVAARIRSIVLGYEQQQAAAAVAPVDPT